MNVSNYRSSEFLEKYKKSPISHPFVVFPALLKIFRNVKNKKILDLGCGSGDFSQMLAEKGANVVGVDISEKWIEICEERHASSKNLKFLVADGSNLKQIRNNTFDFVVMNMVLLNVPKKETIKKSSRKFQGFLKNQGN